MKKALLSLVLTLSVTLSFGQNSSDKKPTMQLVRNATLVLEYAGKKILVDPMLSPKGAIESWAGIEKNPTVELKMPVKDIIKNIDLVIVTHTHEDHFDKIAGKTIDKSTELMIQPADKDYFQKQGFKKATVIGDNKLWNGINIYRLEGQHGSGKVLEMMGKTSGFILKAKNQPTVYIVGDAIWNDDIKSNITKFRPDYIIVNSGGALIKGFEKTPIIMNEEQTMALIHASGQAKVIAVHMDALDHCRTTRSSLRQTAAQSKVAKDKLIIPEDTEVIELSL